MQIFMILESKLNQDYCYSDKNKYIWSVEYSVSCVSAIIRRLYY